MIEAKRKLKDLLIDLIALVKSPASTFKFAVIKSTKGGDELVDEILQLVQDICTGETFEGLEKATIPKDKVVAIKEALTVLKGAVGDLPENVQVAIKALSRIAAYGHSVQEKSADKEEEKPKDEPGVVALLEDIQSQVVNADKKFDAMVTDTQKSKGDIKKSLETLTARLATLEKATGVEKAKSAEETHTKDEETPKEDVWESVIPGPVML